MGDNSLSWVPIIGTAINAWSQERNLEENANQSRIQREWQEEMWNKNNQYNTPLAQKQRLEAAGVNPYSVLAQGGADTGVSSSPAQSYERAKADFHSPMNEDAFLNQRLISEQTRGQQLSNENVGVQNEFVRIKQINECQNLIEDWKKKASERRKNNVDADYEEKQVQFYETVLDSLVTQQQSESRMKQIEAGWKYQELLDKHLDSVVDRMLKQSSIELNDANKASLYQGISESFQRISLMESQKALNYEQVNTEIQKQATEICNRVLGREASQRAWNDLYVNIHQTLFDMWNVGRTMKLPFGDWRPALPGATRDLFEHMSVPYAFPSK